MINWKAKYMYLDRRNIRTAREYFEMKVMRQSDAERVPRGNAPRRFPKAAP